MLYPLVTYHYLVARIRRDTKLPELHFNLRDLKEWIAEAVRSLQAKNRYSQKTACIVYANYSAKLPDDWAGPVDKCSARRHYDTLVFCDAAGTAHLRYYVMPLDTEGMPMLIDDPDALNYFTWYVLEKLAFLSLVPPTFTIGECLRRWTAYKQLAETTLNWPNPGNRRPNRRR